MFHYERLSVILDECLIKILDMKKILTLICFFTSFLSVYAQDYNKSDSTLHVQLNVGGSRYSSKTPVLKIPTDANNHYHMQHKKTDMNSLVPMPNSLQHTIPLQNDRNLKDERYSIRAISKFDVNIDSVAWGKGSSLEYNKGKLKVDR